MARWPHCAGIRDRDRGVVVHVGSALGARSIPLQSAYCGAKHAINGFTSSLRCELVHDHSGVRVTVVQMAAVNTPQFSWVRTRPSHQPQPVPVPPINQPELAAEAVVYAADHPQRKQYWAGGTTAATPAHYRSGYRSTSGCGLAHGWDRRSRGCGRVGRGEAALTAVRR